MTMKCPGFERLIDYLDGQLARAEADHIASHLVAGCADCADTRAWYERVQAVTASDDSVNPPPWVLKRALRIFETERSRPRLVERIGQVLAHLVFDSLARPALAGVRSTETASRQLLYRAGDYSIDLQIAPSDESRANIAGQILKEGEAAFESVSGLGVRLNRKGESVYSTIADHMGEFALSGVDCGLYDLLVAIGKETVTIAGLSVEQP
jgi:hypothetical protein